jgi:hypothetical protein
MTEPRRPLHLAVLFGASATLYALSMAGVAVIQSGADRVLVARQAPADDAADRLRAAHDALDARLARLAAAYARAANGYDSLSTSLGETESSLDDYAVRVEAVSGAAQSLPARVQLPPVSTKVVIRATTRPGTSASTGASGGG